MGKSNRQSNFELLRIVAIIMIIVHHIFCHCINNQILSINSATTGEMFSDPILYKRLSICEIATTFGKIGNNLFLILSGYFLIDKKIDIMKVSKKLLFEMLFVSIIFTVVSFFYVELTNGDAGIHLRYFNSGWWFIGYYFIVILIARCFLNKYISQMNVKEYLSVIMALFAIVSIQYVRNMFKDISEVIPIAATGALMYLIGGFIKLYNPFKKTKTIFILLILVLTNILLYMSYHISVKNLLHRSGSSFHQVIYSYEEYAIPCVIIAICLFELFRRMHIPSSRIINYIASSTFIIYLIHDHPLGRNQFYRIKWVKLLYEQNYGKFILMLFVVVLIVFLLGIILNVIYHFVSILLKRLADSQIDLQ